MNDIELIGMLRILLEEAVDEYTGHASWRCEHPPHYYMAGGPPEDGRCPCGLDDFHERARIYLNAATTPFQQELSSKGDNA